MPEHPRRSAQIDAVKRLQTSRRARRGVVAAYIHELSARHAQAQPQPQPKPAVVKAV